METLEHIAAFLLGCGIGYVLCIVVLWLYTSIKELRN